MVAVGPLEAALRLAQTSFAAMGILSRGLSGAGARLHPARRDPPSFGPE
jgi:hypothetical protein